MDHIEVEGLRIAYRQAGEGPALVLLHGAFSDSRAWRGQLDALCDEFRVVAWDAPGCGGSSDPPESFGMPGYADCLAGFLDALGLERPHVLGLSFGGGLALALYERHPAVPRTLVLASAYAGWAGSLPPGEVERRRRRALRELDLPPEQWVRGYLPGLFTAAAPPEVIDEAVAMMSETRPAGMRAMLSGFADADLRHVLPFINVPTLLLYGDADQRSPLPVAQDLHARIHSSKLVVLPGVGHDSNMEAPDAFNAAVRSFLQPPRR
ncbi:MAG: alpha/beta hydrolase [Euzebyales bacterium]|nr:alpha/beta hydrolase [Euzebyales bacterium]